MSTLPPPDQLRRKGTRAEIWAWSLYDWANSAYSTLLITIVVIYIQSVVFPADSVTTLRLSNWLAGLPGKFLSAPPKLIGGTAYAWGIGISMLLAAVLSPILGAVADARASKRWWLALTALSGAAATIGMYFTPGDNAGLNMALFFIACLGFELSLGFYNGFLPEITTDETIDMVSAYGFALGYIGGAIPLAICIFVALAGDKVGFPAGDAFNADFHETVDGTFTVDLPPGDYRIDAQVGDATLSPQARSSTTDQQVQFAQQPPTPFAAGEVTTLVADIMNHPGGELPLRFVTSDPQHPVIVRGLDIYQNEPNQESRIVGFDFGTGGSPSAQGYLWVTRADGYQQHENLLEERYVEPNAESSEAAFATPPDTLAFGWAAGDIVSRDQVTPPRLRFGLLLLGLWWGGFTIPTLIVLRDRGVRRSTDRTVIDIGRTAFQDVGRTLRDIRRYRNLAIFLVAFLFFNDGIQTVINQASVFATQELAFDITDLTAMILMIQLLAIPGALFVGWLSKKFGQKPTLVGTLIIWIGLLLTAWFVTTKGQFWGLAVVLAMVMGGTQSVARALMGNMTPEKHAAQMFGFFNLSGKATSWMGTMLFGAIGLISGSTRHAILSLIVFFFIGLFLTLWINVQQGREQALREDATA